MTKLSSLKQLPGTIAFQEPNAFFKVEDLATGRIINLLDAYIDPETPNGVFNFINGNQVKGTVRLPITKEKFEKLKQFHK